MCWRYDNYIFSPLGLVGLWFLRIKRSCVFCASSESPPYSGSLLCSVYRGGKALWMRESDQNKKTLSKMFLSWLLFLTLSRVNVAHALDTSTLFIVGRKLRKSFKWSTDGWASFNSNRNQCFKSNLRGTSCWSWTFSKPYLSVSNSFLIRWD